MPTEKVPPLASLFSEIEQTPLPIDIQQGLLRRRIPTQSPCDILIGVQKPENVRTLIARFRVSELPASYEFPEFRSLRVQIQHEMENGVEKTSVILRVVQAAANDIFTSLAEDVCRVTADQAEETQAAITFQRRLLQWQQLLQKTGATGLTEEQQQGLYGELYCLRDILLPQMQQTEALSAWTGPEATAKDFQFTQSIALEVKTTLAKEPQQMTITSEKQLDDNGLNALYLLNVSVEKMQGAGETLPEITESIRSALSANTFASALLEDKLLASGYSDTHAPHYMNAGYTQRKVRCFRVQSGFPRLVERDLPDGVGNVRYLVSVAACLPFTVEVSDFTDLIGGQS